MRFVPPRRASFVQAIPPIRPIGLAIEWAMRVLPQRLLRPFLMKFLTTVLGPSPALFGEGAILVNRDGQRFADEKRGPAAAVARQPGKKAYIVFDGALAEKFSAWPNFISTAPGIAYAYLDDYRRCRQDIFHSAVTAADLAERVGMPAANLSETLRGIGAQPPFFALGPVRSYVVFTEGGLRVNEQHEVLREDGSVIEGLQAVGSVGQGGVLLEGHGHHLGWAFISGRRAGEICAARAPVAIQA
jgi:succinate dehydrogenase/fumarate reductase flavoprotein subunit